MGCLSSKDDKVCERARAFLCGAQVSARLQSFTHAPSSWTPTNLWSRKAQQQPRAGELSIWPPVGVLSERAVRPYRYSVHFKNNLQNGFLQFAVPMIRFVDEQVNRPRRIC